MAILKINKKSLINSAEENLKRAEEAAERERKMQQKIDNYVKTEKRRRILFLSLSSLVITSCIIFRSVWGIPKKR